MTVARLRRWYWEHIRRYRYELCDDCGRPYWDSLGGTYWSAPDELWLEVMGTAAGTLCPRCFTIRSHVHFLNSKTFVWWQAQTDA